MLAGLGGSDTDTAVKRYKGRKEAVDNENLRSNYWFDAKDFAPERCTKRIKGNCL